MNTSSNNKKSQRIMDDTPTSGALSIRSDNMPNILCLIPLFERPFFSPQNLPVLLDSKYLKSSIEKINQTEDKIGGFIVSDPLTRFFKRFYNMRY